MSYRAIAQVAVAPLPGAGELGRRLLCILAGYADDEGREVFPSIRALCEEHGIERRSATKAIARLIKCGYLVDTGGRRSASRVVYEIPLKRLGSQRTHTVGSQGTLGPTVPHGVPADPGVGSQRRPDPGSQRTHKPVSKPIKEACQSLVGKPADLTEAQPVLELVSSEPSLVEQLLADEPAGGGEGVSASMLKALAKRPHAIDAARFVRWYGPERAKAMGMAETSDARRINSKVGLKRVRAVLSLLNEKYGGEWAQMRSDLRTAARGLLANEHMVRGGHLDIARCLCRDVEQFERNLRAGQQLAKTGAHPSDNRRQQRESCMGDWPEPPPLTDEQRATRQRLLDSLPVRQGWGKTA